MAAASPRVPCPLSDSRDQLLWRDVLDVAAGRRRVRVSKLCLNHVDRHVLRREFGCMCMSETVRMDALLDPRAAREPGEKLPDI